MKVYTFGAVRRSIPIVVIVLAAAVTTANAKNPPTPPAGTWDLSHTRLTYAGPGPPVRSVVMRLVPRRAAFTPVCNAAQQCTVSTLVTTTSGRQFRLKLTPTSGAYYAGSRSIRTGLRCRGRKLTARVLMTARMIERLQEPGTALLGTTQVSVDNPGGCRLFHGKRRAVRKTWFTGFQV